MSERNQRKTRTGVVVSNKADKTIVVSIERQFVHAKYGKTVRKTKKYYAHDEQNVCTIGDIVTIMETRPLSKLKCWRLETVVVKAK